MTESKSISDNKETALQELGLTEPQARVYLAALELGQASMQELAKKSGVKRTSIYNFINELKDKKLIYETSRKKRKVYTAANPRQLVALEEDRLEKLKDTLPDFLMVYNQQKRKPRFTYYEGKEGVKEVYQDTLQEGQPITAFTDYENMKEVMGQEYWDWYPNERARRNITFKTIARDSTATREISKKNIKHLRELTTIQDDIKTEINIYGNKVGMMNFRANKPFAILIEDQDLADTLRTVWKKLWQKLQ